MPIGWRAAARRWRSTTLHSRSATAKFVALLGPSGCGKSTLRYLIGGLIGGAMIQASRFAGSPGVFAGIVEISVAGLCLVRGMAIARRHVLRWHQEAQDPATV